SQITPNPTNTATGGAESGAVLPMRENTVEKTAANHTAMPNIQNTTSAVCQSSACNAWKRTNFESCFTMKITRGPIHQVKICRTWASIAMVLSSWVGA